MYLFCYPRPLEASVFFACDGLEPIRLERTYAKTSRFCAAGTSPHPRGHIDYRFMAIFHLHAKIIGRSNGQSSLASAAYRSGEELEDFRTREIHRHGRAERVAHNEIIAPPDAPDWARSRADLWNQVEARESRKNSQLSREFELALPRELNLYQQRKLVRSWVAAELTPHGVIADVAVHVDDRNNNPHAHIMTTLRSVSDEGWAAHKLRSFEDRAALANWRESWANHANAALERAGREERIDHRSHADRGLEEEPTIKEGWVARQMTSNGHHSDRVVENNLIRKINRRTREKARKAAQPARDKLRGGVLAQGEELRRQAQPGKRVFSRGPDQADPPAAQRKRPPQDLTSRGNGPRVKSAPANRVPEAAPASAAQPEEGPSIAEQALHWMRGRGRSR